MNDFRRGLFDVLLPVLGVLGVLIFGNAIFTGIDMSSAVRQTTKIKGRIVRIDDRRPYDSRPDRTFLEYPLVAYSDETGALKHAATMDGAWPRYFHVGQEVEIGNVGGSLHILDKWYFWQSRLIWVALSSCFVCGAIYYFANARPRYERSKKTPNQSPEPTLGTVH